jgi:hypothetical protein
VTNSEVSNDLPDKPTSDNEQPDKPPSDRNLKSRLRARLQLIGGTLASIAAVGAIAGGLVGYWNVWKTLRTDVFPESQKTQREATARPDIVPRLSLVVLPFANLNNDPEQDYFADGITTDLTTDLAQMPGAFVIGRGAALGSAEVCRSYEAKPHSPVFHCQSAGGMHDQRQQPGCGHAVVDGWATSWRPAEARAHRLMTFGKPSERRKPPARRGRMPLVDGAPTRFCHFIPA